MPAPAPLPSQPDQKQKERRRQGKGTGSGVAWQAGAISLSYAALAVLWIYFSDQALGGLVANPELLVRLSVFKGLFFVAITAGLLFFLMRRVFGRIESSYVTLQSQQEEIERMRRLYAALSQINQAIVRLPQREELLTRFCQVLVEQGGFRMAWIGWEEKETHRLIPVASWGNDRGYVDNLNLRTDDTPAGRGPTGTAFREARPMICDDFLDRLHAGPWRPEAEKRGFRSSAAFPIRQNGEVCGVLNVYADELGYFKDREVSLLEEAAADVSFALDNLVREAERCKAEEAARAEKRFSDTMIDSMPGILYFYDASGRFLRWNRNFQITSGYAPDEIAKMNPMDFFTEEDKPLLAERIARVFSEGEANVEARFLAKDGSTLPYLFTGRRVEFENSQCLVGVGIDIGQRLNAERGQRESEERFHAFMDSSPAIAWMNDEAGRHLYMNRAWSRAFGLKREEWLGKTAYDLVSYAAAEKIRRSDDEVLALGHPIEIPEDYGEIDGRPFVWNCFKFPFRNAAGERFVGGIAIDITERKQAESELRELRGRFEVVVENLREGLIIADPQGELLHWNPASLRLLGFGDISEGRRRQREFSKLFELTTLDGTVVPENNWPLARVRRGDQFENLELRVRRRDSNWERTFSYAGSLVRYAGDKALAFMTLIDITDRKRAEAQLREANVTLEHKVDERTAELQAALVRAEAADRIKSAFLATMSHELRTPLNSIIGFTGIVLQGLAGPLNPEQTKQLGMVRGSARHLLELINDVLDISKIEAGQLEVRAEPFVLSDTIDRVVASVRPLAEKKNLSVSVNRAEAPAQIVGDRRRVEQILINLLSNGIKFTERGGVTLTVEPARLPLAGDADGSNASPRPAVGLRVTDTGIGIKPADLAHLFQPFRQIDTGLSRQHEGTGLGLAICRRLAELMGGQITARSEWGRGSEFRVVLPLNPRPS